MAGLLISRWTLDVQTRRCKSSIGLKLLELLRQVGHRGFIPRCDLLTWRDHAASDFVSCYTSSGIQPPLFVHVTADPTSRPRSAARRGRGSRVHEVRGPLRTESTTTNAVVKQRSGQRLTTIGALPDRSSASRSPARVEYARRSPAHRCRCRPAAQPSASVHCRQRTGMITG
jgi:hypothetical protein